MKPDAITRDEAAACERMTELAKRAYYRFNSLKLDPGNSTLTVVSEDQGGWPFDAVQVRIAHERKLEAFEALLMALAGAMPAKDEGVVRVQVLRELQSIARGADGLYDADTNTVIKDLPGVLEAHHALEERADHAYMERDRLRDECAAWKQRAEQAEYTVGFAMGTLTDLADAWESQKRGGSEAEADLLQRHADQMRRLVDTVNKLGGETIDEAMIERAAEALRHPDHWPTVHYEGLTTAHANEDFETDTRAAAIAVLKAVMKP